jgi:hypothetical protein
MQTVKDIKEISNAFEKNGINLVITAESKDSDMLKSSILSKIHDLT